MSDDPVVIVGMSRTPMGSFNGVLSDASGPDLGAAAIKAALERSGVAPADVDEVIMGCVLPHGQRQGPARQAAHLRWHSRCGWCHHDQQALWFGHESHHARP